jgi:hypothetical protein
VIMPNDEVSTLLRQVLANLEKSPAVPKLALTRDETAIATGMSLRKVDMLIADRTSGFPVARVGRKVVIPVDSLRQWLHDRIGTPP